MADDTLEGHLVELEMVCQQGISNIMLLVIMPQSGTIIVVSYRDSQLLPMDTETTLLPTLYMAVKIFCWVRKYQNSYSITSFLSSKTRMTKKSSHLNFLCATVVIYFLFFSKFSYFFSQTNLLFARYFLVPFISYAMYLYIYPFNHLLALSQDHVIDRSGAFCLCCRTRHCSLVKIVTN